MPPKSSSGPNDINIRVISHSEGTDNALKGLEDIRKANKKLEDEGDKAHEKQKKQYKEKKDLGEKLGDQFKELGSKIVAAFAVEKIIEFGAECVKAFEEAEAAASQLQFAVENVGKESGKGLEKLTKFNEAFQNSTKNLFSGKDVDKAEATLVKFGLTTEQVTQLMPRLAGAASQTGVTLEEMAGKVSSAFLNGPKALNKELGTQIAKSGDQVKQFELIYKGLGDFTEGVNKKMETSAGKAQISANKLEKIQENYGKELAPKLEDAKIKVFGLINDISAFQMAKDLIYAQITGKLGPAGASFVKDLDKGLDAVAKATDKLEEGRNHDKTQLQKYLDEIAGMNDKAIEDHIKAAEDEDDTVYKKILPAGYKELEAALKKEQDLRKKNQEEYKNKIKQFYADLEAIKKKDADENTKLDIALIKDETEKKLAQEKDAYNKEIEGLEISEKKLLEISTKGNAEQRTQALKELNKLYHDKDLALQVYNQNILNINKEHNQKLLDQQLAADEEQLHHDKAMHDIFYESEKEQLDLSLAKKKISVEKYNEELRKLEAARLKDQLTSDLAADDATISELQKKLDLAIQNGDDTTELDEQLKKAQNKRDEDAARDQLAIQKQSDAAQLAAKKEFAEKIKETVEQTAEAANAFLEGMATAAESNIESLNGEIAYQNEVLADQRLLAQNGMANDLAFEIKHRADLEKEKIAAEKKLAAIKEAEVFINSVAKFSETDPKTAIPKALAILAATKSVEAIYKEEGGIIGHGGPKSLIGFGGMSRLHPGGGDVLVHAQTGEGMLSRKEMANLGIGNFNMLKSMLKTPFNEKLIPNKGSSIMLQDNSALLARLDSLEQTIKNKKEVQIDFDQLNTWIEKTTENGVTNTVRKMNKNHRI